jgi:hypothetical protein
MSEVVPIREDAEQLEFDGLPVKETAFKIVGGSKLYTDRKFGPDAEVNATIRLRLKGHSIDYDTGRLTNVFEVLDAELHDSP